MALRVITPVGCSRGDLVHRVTWVRAEGGAARVCMVAQPWQSLGLQWTSLFSVCETFQPRSEKKETQFRLNASAELASGGGDDGGRGVKGGGGDGEGDGDGDDSTEGAGAGNSAEALLVLSSAGRALQELPGDLAYAIKDGRITGAIVQRYLELEKSPFLAWLLRFGGFKERLLADDLFLTKVGIECGVGLFTKTAAELERRRENFGKELDFVVADVVMALIADFMLVWLPAPTVSLRPPLATNAGKLAKFFSSCPDNSFQVAIRGTSYSTLQRIGAMVRNGGKLLAVGTSASLVGTATTNLLISMRGALDKNSGGASEDLPIISTSLAYGVYMAVSSNFRYQVLAGVVEQRVLEPWLHNQKLLLSVLCFAVRTGNTFLGSLMWVDYARFVGSTEGPRIETIGKISSQPFVLQTIPAHLLLPYCCR